MDWIEIAIPAFISGVVTALLWMDLRRARERLARMKDELRRRNPE